MNKLLFHIAKRDGVEFVSESGTAFSHPMHTHLSVHIITVIRKGIVRLTRRSSTTVHPAGSVYITAPHEPHRAASSEAFDAVSLCIDKNHFHQMERPSLAQKCLEYSTILTGQNLLCATTVQQLLAGIDAIYYALAVAKNAAGTGTDGLEPLARGNDEALDTMAPAHMSPFQFIRQFKLQTGLTPHQYVVQNRLRKAKQLLATGASIADIAARTGFYDQSHLNRWFNKRMGITPRLYKNSCFFLDT